MTATPNLSRILDKKIAIVGYWQPGPRHALNLKDSGVKNVAVALKPSSATPRSRGRRPEGDERSPTASGPT